MSEIGHVTGGQGNVVIVGTDGARVTLQTRGTAGLTAGLLERFGQLYVSACWRVTAPGGAP